MRIGILSDTHDRVAAMKAAIELLVRERAEFFIHCGDVGSERILDHFAGLPSAFVWGNNDFDRMELQRYAAKLGIACYGAFGDIELGRKRFAIMHGDDFRLRQRILIEQLHDYLLQGHTHVRMDQRMGKIRCINPGALHRAAEKTVALLETDADALTFFRVEEPNAGRT
jgi:putative phosphoesterase